jgi:3-hydroxyisobutyrate dehydrogenase
MCTALPSIGFIGLGVMGLPMARHLCDAGYPVTVYNRTTARVQQAETFGAYTAASPRIVGERCDILITMLTHPAAVRAVMEGPDGALNHPKKGLVWIQMSTLDIGSTLAFAQAAESRGVIFIDAPVTGSKKQVEEAQLIILAGAERQALEFVRPVLSRLGKTIVEAGPVGAGTALKLCMNLIVAQMTTALAEAVTLARTTKIDPALIFQVLKASPALNCAYYGIKEPAFLKGDFTPAFSLDNMAKDVGFMQAEARSRGVELPVTQAVQALLEKARAQGHGDKDLSAVLLVLQHAQSL